MDNKLNEIRRKIRFLRSEMLQRGGHHPRQVNRDEDCSGASIQLMAMRVVMLGLIAERNRLGGEEQLLDVGRAAEARLPRSEPKTAEGRAGRRER